MDESRQPALRTRLIAIIAMPLFFIVTFTLCYVSAMHAPVPNDMPIMIAGEPAITEQIATGIQDQSDDGFDITEVVDADAARTAVTERESAGAFIIDGTDVTTIVASGGSVLASSTLQRVGTLIATNLGGVSTVEDLAPMPADDPSGTALFFYLVVCTVGAFMSVTVISQVLRRPKLTALIATNLGAALLVPIIGFAMISVFVDFGTNFGSVAAVIGVAMVYSLTVGLIASLLSRIAGQGAVLIVVLLLIAFNLPSTGASVPGSMLPGFWQAIHGTWIGSGAFETMRSILFFDGHGVGRWLAQLFIWLGSAIVLLGLIEVIALRRAKAARSATTIAPEKADASRTLPEALVVDPIVS